MFPTYNFNWNNWYAYNFQNVLLPRKSSDFLWKQFYGLLQTESTLKRWGKSNGNCKCCSANSDNDNNDSYENTEHLFIYCQYRAKIWTLVQELLREVFGQTITISRLEIMAGYFKDDLDKNSCLVISMILGMSKYSIWLSRNLIKHENKIIGFQECLLRLKHYIMTHAKVLILSNKTENSIKEILVKVRSALDLIFTQDRNEAWIQQIL